METDSLYETFAGMGKAMYEMYENPHELGAIWLNMPIMTNEGIKIRIEAGMLVYYNEGAFGMFDTNFNKRILICYGTLINQFIIKVEDLKTGEQSIINL